MSYFIKSRYDDSKILFESKTAKNVKECVVEAVKSGADLSGADLSRANCADLAIAQTRILPEGDLVGWKKCRNNVIVKLWIPYAAKRTHAFGRKCRAEYAQVIEIFGAEVGISQYDGKTEYRAGVMIKPDSFDEDWTKECSNGVHFYISRIEAENH